MGGGRRERGSGEGRRAGGSVRKEGTRGVGVDREGRREKKREKGLGERRKREMGERRENLDSKGQWGLQEGGEVQGFLWNDGLLGETTASGHGKQKRGQVGRDGREEEKGRGGEGGAGGWRRKGGRKARSSFQRCSPPPCSACFFEKSKERMMICLGSRRVGR